MRYVLVHSAGLTLLVLLFDATGFLLELAAPDIRRVQLPVWVRRVAMGAAAWMYAVFALAAAQCLTRAFVLPLVTAILVAGTIARAKSEWTWPGQFTPRDWLNASATTIAPLAAPIAALILLFVATLRPEIGYDANTYHLTLPKIFVAHGGFRDVPFSVYSNWPLNIQLLFGLAMLIQDHVLAKLLVLLFLVALCTSVYQYARIAHSRLAGAIAVSLLLANEVVLRVAETAYIDIGLALFLFLAFVLATQYLDERRRSLLVLSGLFCGVAAGIKMNGLFTFVSIAAMTMGAILTERGSGVGSKWRTAFRASADLGLPTMALVLPWFIKSYAYTGNPVYPLFYDVFGGPSWSSTLSDQFLGWQRSIGMGRSIRDYLLLPMRVLLADSTYGRFRGRLNWIWVVLIPVTFLVLGRASVRRCMATSGMFFCLWAASTQETRYLIPIVPLLSCAAGVALASGIVSLSCGLTSGLTRGRVSAVRVELGLAIALIGGIQLILIWMARHSFRRAFSFLLMLAAGGTVDLARPTPDAFRFINSNLPSSAKVMLLNNNQGFFLDREYVADSFFEASQIAETLWEDPTADGVASIFNRLGITHLLVTRNTRNIQYPPALSDFVNDARRCRLVYTASNPESLLYEVVR